MRCANCTTLRATRCAAVPRPTRELHESRGTASAVASAREEVSVTPSRETGFSLVELLTVVALASILIAIGLPSYGRYRKTLLQWQVREQLIQDLRGARQTAITKHTPVAVVFGNGATNTNLTTYSVHTDLNADGIAQAGEPRTLKKLPKGGLLTAVQLTPNDSLTFETSGLLRSGSGGGRLIFSTKAGVRDTLLVSVAGLAYHP
jgi:prepilin-type N-terminal cleavage/methylation domain-containing protein